MIKYIPGFFFIAMAVHVFFFMEARFIYTDSASMAPSIRPDERMVAIGLNGDYPERDSIINFNFRENGRARYIKRVVGLPGDRIEVKDGRLYLNGELEKEPYLYDEAMDYDLPSVVVPEGHVFVLGDNRNNSFDSADWGFLPARDILGKVVMVYWPCPRFLD